MINGFLQIVDLLQFIPIHTQAASEYAFSCACSSIPFEWFLFILLYVVFRSR